MWGGSLASGLCVTDVLPEQSYLHIVTEQLPGGRERGREGRGGGEGGGEGERERERERERD